jgi:hypothetical protein
MGMAGVQMLAAVSFQANRWGPDRIAKLRARRGMNSTSRRETGFAQR